MNQSKPRTGTVRSRSPSCAAPARAAVPTSLTNDFDRRLIEMEEGWDLAPWSLA